MSKRQRRSRPAKPKRRSTSRRRPERRREEPDLIEQIADTLADDDPLPLLAMASTMLAVFDPRSLHPFRPEPEIPSRDEFVESFLGVPLPETSALLTAVAALSGDEVLRRRVSREIADRAHALPEWLAGIARATVAPDPVEVVHVLGDGDDVLVAVTLPGGHVLTAVVFIEHNLGSVVKDAFVVAGTLEEVVATVGEASGHDPDTVCRPLPAADARTRITDAVERGSRTFPPHETETWPSCRALVEWIVAMLPEGGSGYERPEWDDDAVAALTQRFRASPFAAGLHDPGDMLSSLLWFGTDYGPGDPMRWSPVSVEILLVDWIPRKIVADVGMLAPAPDVLRALVRFCHHERGIRQALTDETLASIDVFEPEYRRLIRTDRPQGAHALALAALGASYDDLDDDLDDGDAGVMTSEIMLDTLRRAVGGDVALNALDADPLPDEPFAWEAVPADVHERVGEVLALVERCCTELLDDEYRTACRRLLADAAAGDPEVFRRRARVDTVAAAVCWLAGKANALFDPSAGRHVIDGQMLPTMQVKELAAHFGVTASAVSPRGGVLLRAIGIDAPTNYINVDLGTTRYLIGARRAQILADRERYRAMAD